LEEMIQNISTYEDTASCVKEQNYSNARYSLKDRKALRRKW